MSPLKFPPVRSPVDLQKLTDEDLDRRLVVGLKNYADCLLDLAATWVEKERRGHDMTALRTGIGRYLPAIAAGTVLPDVVARFAGNSALLKAVASLTPEQQLQLLADERVDVCERKNGHHEVRHLPLTSLSGSQIRLVFADRSIRTETEQVAILFSPAPKWVPKKKLRQGRVTIDRTQETVAIGQSQVSIQEMLDALKDAGII